MVAPRDGAEVGHALPDLLHGDMGLSVIADSVEEARPKSDWNVLNRSEINQVRLGLAFQVVRRVFLEPLLDAILGPVDFRLNRYRLAT